MISPLVNCPAVPHRNKYGRRGTPVRRVILHMWAGVAGGDTHLAKASVKASTNYFVYSDGGIAVQVPEQYRAWTSGSAAADNPSITIETQNSTMGPKWEVSDKALEAIARLVADIAKRYGWGTITPDRLRGHREFQSTTCPGPYLWDRMGYLRDQANKILHGGSTPITTRYVRPVAPEHRVTAAYRIPGSWQLGYHTGHDFGCPVGTPVHAVTDGDVRDRGSLMGPDYGRVVTINEDDDSGGAGAGSDWHYCHMDRAVVKPGQRVKAGQLIGYSGNTGRSTGPHLHLERRPRNGRYGTDMDPVLWDDSPAVTSPKVGSKPATPHAIDQEDPVPKICEVPAYTIDHAGEDWQTSKEHPLIGADVIGPIVYDGSAIIMGPEGANVSYRWAVLNRQTGKWTHREDPVPLHGSRGRAAISNAHTGADPEVSIFLDVLSDKPGKVLVTMQRAKYWAK